MGILEDEVIHERLQGCISQTPAMSGDSPLIGRGYTFSNFYFCTRHHASYSAMTSSRVAYVRITASILIRVCNVCTPYVYTMSRLVVIRVVR